MSTDMLLLTLSGEQRRHLARAALIAADRQRYGATADPDTVKRAKLRQEWLAIADAFDPEPWGPGERVRELAARAREAAEATS